MESKSLFNLGPETAHSGKHTLHHMLGPRFKVPHHMEALVPREVSQAEEWHCGISPLLSVFLFPSVIERRRKKVSLLELSRQEGLEAKNKIKY